MYKINNILLCGLGGVGCVCAASIIDADYGTLKILVDKSRYQRYKTNPTSFNSKTYDFDYILPDDTNFKADLIIIATKNEGLSEAIVNIKNFIKEDTIIISLLNGIHSESEIEKVYNAQNILISFYIGASCIREGRNIRQNGKYEIVIGTKQKNQKEILKQVCTFFDKTNIKYKVSENILDEYWKKFLINVGINQLSASTKLTLKEIKKDSKFVSKLKLLMEEAEQIAEKEGIKNHKQIYESAVKFLLEELEDAEPSMLQDIKAGRKTEVDIFAGEIIKLAKKHNINTPENIEIFNEIKQIEKNKKIL